MAGDVAGDVVGDVVDGEGRRVLRLACSVYRHFPDRAALAYDLLDDAERELQHGFLFGPPPLGPGACQVPDPASGEKGIRDGLRDLLRSIIGPL